MLKDKNELFKYLDDNKIFSDFTDFELIEIVKRSMVKIIRKDRAVYYQGDKAEAVYFILSGSVRKIKYRNDGTSLTTGTALNGEWLGLAELVASGTYLTDALAREESYLLCIPRNEFIKLLESNNFQKHILRSMAKGYYSIHSHIEDYTPRGKIVRFLLAHCESFTPAGTAKDNYCINITQEDLADFIGFTRETVNRHLKMLAEEEIIRFSRGKIEIPDYERLKDADRE